VKEIICQHAQDLGFDACRVSSASPPETAGRFRDWLNAERHGEMAYLARNAYKREDPQQVLPGAESLITLAVSYATEEDLPGSTPSPSGLESATAGRVARYARYRDYHDRLAEPLRKLTDEVNRIGGHGTRSLWYVDTGPVLERDFAQRAGLGFIGKHTNLISRRLGNWLFLCEILTTLELPPDQPERNRCGTCRRCIDACPTEAITAPFQLDARRCISYLTIELKGSIPESLRPAIGTRIFGCDDCLEVCPWNRFARTGRLMQDQSCADLETPDLLDLLALDTVEFRKRYRATPLWRIKRRGLLRNVCVALGNAGETRALAALERASKDPEPLIAEHANWAIKQLERQSDDPSGQS